MTKKHFIALASALKTNAPNQAATEQERELFAGIVRSVMSACASVDDRFDRQRFAIASGPPASTVVPME